MVVHLLHPHGVEASKRKFGELFQRRVVLINSVLDVFAPIQNNLDIVGLVFLTAQIQHASKKPNAVLNYILSIVNQGEVCKGHISQIAL